MKERGKRWIDPEKKFVIHPDMLEAFRGYDGKKDAFKETFEARDEAVKRGEIYWNTDHDSEMKSTAEERSRRFNFRFPFRKRK